MTSKNGYCLGIDIGTSSCKVSVVADSGELIGSASRPYPIYSPIPGWSEQDPTDWLDGVVQATNQALSSTGINRDRVRWAGLTSAAHIAVLTDGNDIPLRRAILWNDQRSFAEVSEHAGIAEFIQEKTFNRVSTTWTLPHLLWIRNHEPEVFEKIRHIYLSKDFVNRWLTGEAVSDPATAVASMLYDAATGQWSNELCGLVGLSTMVLPRVAPVMSVAGRLNASAADKLNLPTGIPIVNGTLDSASETYASGAIRAKDCVIRLGTAGGIHVVKEAPRPHPQLITYPHPIQGLWYSQAGTNSAGSAITQMKSIFRKETSFDDMIELASKVPAGADGVFFHPFLSGERCPYWSPQLRGTFSGISFQHGPDHFIRAVMEGVCFSLNDAFLTISGIESCSGELRVVGGGAANKLWTRILCDVLGRPLVVMHGTDSAYGAALLSLATIDDRSPKHKGTNIWQECVEPDKKSHIIYQRAFETYKKRSLQLLTLYRD
jgi:xylulokinase